MVAAAIGKTDVGRAAQRRGSCGLPSWGTATPSLPVIDAAALPGDQTAASCQAPCKQSPGATGGCRCKAGFDESEPCESSACRMPCGSSYAFHFPDQRGSVVALPIGSGMWLRCRPQPCRRTGGQGQRLSGTAAPTLGGCPMPLSRFPLANCPLFLGEGDGGSAGALDHSFLSPAQSW